jgi:hypothetical protein
MEAKQVRSLMEAYASVYEGYGKKKKGDCVSKSEKGAHNCAKKVCHEEYGEGECIFGQHAVPDENGFVSHYDVQFEHGIVENVSVKDLEILISEDHPTAEGHRYEGEQLDEMVPALEKPVKGALDAGAEFMNKHPVGQAIKRVLSPAGPGRRTVTKQENERKIQQNSADLYDIVKGYLMSEGLTEEEALKAMLVLTDEERSAILEEVGIVGPPKKAIDAIPGVRSARIAAANAVKRSDYGPNDEVKKVGKHVVPSARLGGKFDRPGGTKYKDISGDK